MHYDAVSSIDEIVLQPLSDGFIIMFADNLGFAQIMEKLFSAAIELREVKISLISKMERKKLTVFGNISHYYYE